MVNAVTESGLSATPDDRKLRNAQRLRAASLLLVGLVIAFTGILHSDLGFDITLVFISLLLIGVVTAVEYWTLRGTAESWWVAARATVAFAAAGSMLAAPDTETMAIILAIWAGLTAVITTMRLVRGVQTRSVAIPSLLLSAVLAIAVLLVQHDPVAVVGFFGAYAVVRAVFLGIATLDRGSAAANVTE